MKIEVTETPKQTLEEFADEHGLTLRVNKRLPGSSPPWFAYFYGVEVSQGGGLLGVHGNGLTPLAAVKDYAHKISNRRLVLNAQRCKRVQSPTLTVETDPFAAPVEDLTKESWPERLELAFGEADADGRFSVLIDEVGEECLRRLAWIDLSVARLTLDGLNRLRELVARCNVVERLLRYDGRVEPVYELFHEWLIEERKRLQ